MRGLKASTVYMEKPDGEVVPVDLGSIEDAWKKAEGKADRLAVYLVLLWLVVLCGVLGGVAGLIAGWW